VSTTAVRAGIGIPARKNMTKQEEQFFIDLFSDYSNKVNKTKREIEIAKGNIKRLKGE